MSGCESCPARLQLAQTGIKHGDYDRVIALAGNPNTGKSTLFNAIILRLRASAGGGKSSSRKLIGLNTPIGALTSAHLTHRRHAA